MGSQVGGPGGLPPHGLTPEALMALKKTRMDGVGPPFLNGAPPNPHTFMAQYMALNGGALPHPALLAPGGLPLPPHPAAPWTQPLQQPHGHPDLPFKAGPHPEAIARSLACRASYDEVLKQLDRFREDQSRSDRLLGLDRDERDIVDRDTPGKPNGYGEADVLNLSSKSDSHEDLTEAGLGGAAVGRRRVGTDDGDRDSREGGGEERAESRGRPSSSPSPLRETSVPSKYHHQHPQQQHQQPPHHLHHNSLPHFNSYNHHSLLGRHHVNHNLHHDEDNEKEEAISDNDDYDDKNDISDHDDFDFAADRSFKSVHNNNNQSTANHNIHSSSTPTTNGGGGGLLGALVGGGGGSSSSSSTSSSVLGRPAAAGDRIEDRLVGLPIAGGLMGLGLAAHAGEAAAGGVAGAGGAATPGVGGGSIAGLAGPPLSSLENLLGNIQNLLKVATESVRHEEREKEQLRSEFLRQKDIKERLEKQLLEDEKQKELYQRHLKRERRARRKLEEELTEKLKRLSQYEPGMKELLKSAEGMSQEVKHAAVAAAVAAVVSASAVSGSLTTATASLTGVGGLGAGGPPTMSSTLLGGGGVSGGGGGGSLLVNGGGGDDVSVSLSGGGSNGSGGGGGGVNGSTGGAGGGLHLSPAAASSPPKKESSRLSPKSPSDMDLRPPTVSSTDGAASLFFSKSLLFNCTA